MKRLIDLTADEARTFFLKGSSYFNSDLPEYISFEPILSSVSKILQNKDFKGFSENPPPDQIPNVNYSFLSNKDGRFAWRPLELLHPAIYVSLVNLLCADENWKTLCSRFESFAKGVVTCCSIPIIPEDGQKPQAGQVSNWWQRVEQKSLFYSLEFNHIIQTDVADCYGSLYTHSICWAIHGLNESKKHKGNGKLLGDKIDLHIRAGRYGQTNGISQGSVLMDFIAELVLGYVDELIAKKAGEAKDFKVLRYRDDYRIFSNSDTRAEELLKIVSESLWAVGMRLNVSKTHVGTNVIEASIKADKLAGIEINEISDLSPENLQRKLLRLHSFGRKYPNSGTLRKLVSNLLSKIVEQQVAPSDLDVQVAIATDISIVSPQTFPAIAGILSHLISLKKEKDAKKQLWTLVYYKMRKVPYNGYLDLWLQRVTKTSASGFEFESDDLICKVVDGQNVELWDSSWISSKKLKEAINPSAIVVKRPSSLPEVMSPKEVELFSKNALYQS